MRKIIIFDMDGVLFDTENLSQRCWDESGKRIGIENINEVTHKWIGSDVREAKRIFDEAFGGRFTYEEVRADKLRTADWHILEEGIPIKKGTPELLEALKNDGWTIALATSTERGKAFRELSLAHFDHYFSCSVHGGEVKRGKPSPDIYLACAEKIGVLQEEISDIYVVEDSHNGVRAANAAGMKVLMVPDLLPVTEEMERLAHKIFDDLTQVQSYLIQ